jgi:glucose-1-phosphate cytidylyltransferase
MKVIILAGGLPSTLNDEDEKIPKPMAEIGERPLLWHIMKQFSFYGYNDFVICTGYKGEVIKNYFMNYYIYQSDITVDLKKNDIKIHRKQTEDWRVTIIDTGLHSSIIERLRRVRCYADGEPAFVVYGDCLSDIDIRKLAVKHRASNCIATFAMAHPTGRNEILPVDEDGEYLGINKQEKVSEAWADACCMILEQEAFDCLLSPQARIPFSLMDVIAQQKPIQTYRHEGFWSPVETARDKNWLEFLWKDQTAPWKVWED